MAFPKILIIAAVAASLGACVSGSKQFLKKPFVAPSSIAVLPMNNHTNDLDGPVIVRHAFDERIASKKGYRTKDLVSIDAGLKALGITDGGQLPSVTPQRLGETLGVEALVYGELLDFGYKTTGFLNIRSVRAKFRMVDAKSGELLWEKEARSAKSTAALSAGDALKKGLAHIGSQVAGKIGRNPLREQVEDMAWDAIEFLPRGGAH
ncbi:MAG: GNA1162 family protein [Elusimicrobiota bacterium]